MRIFWVAGIESETLKVGRFLGRYQISGPDYLAIMRIFAAILISLVVLGCKAPQQRGGSTFAEASVSYSAGWETLANPTTEMGPQSIEDLVEAGLANNPRLREADHKIQALKHRIPQHLSLPDPQLRTVTHLDPVETAAGRQAFGLGIDQKWTRPERRDVRASMANEAVKAAMAGRRNLELEIAEEIRAACIQTLMFRESVRLAKQEFEKLKQLEEYLLGKYESGGSTSQNEILEVQIELSQLENRLRGVEQKEKACQARLARLLHCRPGVSFEIKGDLLTPRAKFDLESLTAQAMELRPDLEQQLANIRKERRGICLAHLQNRPDLTVGLNWIATSSQGISGVANGDDSVLLGVGFNLPVYKSRIRAAVCEAKENASAAEARLQIIQDEIAEQVFDSVTKLDNALLTIEVIESDILPKSSSAAEFAQSEFESGSGSLEKVIVAHQNRIRHQTTLVNLRAQYMLWLAELAMRVGQLEPVDLEIIN